MLELEQLQKSLSDITNLKLNELNRLFSIYEAQLPIKKDEITKIYQDAAKPNSKEAYDAALKFLKGDLSEDSYLYDLVAFALNRTITELDATTVISNEQKLSELLDRYSKEVDVGEFWVLTCLGVLQSYFQVSNFDSAVEKIRIFLESKFKRIYELSDHKPLWMTALNDNLHLLSPDPCLIYAQEWLNGRDDRVSQIRSDIQIPENSWFWKELITSCIRETTKLDDIAFKHAIPKLLNFIKQHPAYLDAGLLATLARYHNCSDKKPNKDLKDLSVALWKSPRLRNVGGSKWFTVEEPIWQMVLGWVNEANLRLFFQLLKRRGVADKNRLDFWLRYINQVRWTKLVLGNDTYGYFKSNPEMATVFENEKDSFSSLEGESSLDAFIMKIGNYLIVEFSTEGGCYIYKDGENTFDPESLKLNPSTTRGGLKEKRKVTGSPDIIHAPGWQDRAELKLQKLSIFPDVNSNLQMFTTPQIDPNKYFKKNSVITPDCEINISKTQESQVDLNEFEQVCKIAESLAIEYGIRTENLKYKNDNYWVYLDKERGPLSAKLKELGFKYIAGKGWWI